MKSVEGLQDLEDITCLSFLGKRPKDGHKRIPQSLLFVWKGMRPQPSAKERAYGQSHHGLPGLLVCDFIPKTREGGVLEPQHMWVYEVCQ